MNKLRFLTKEAAENIGFNDIINMLEVRTPFGRQEKSILRFYGPGEEEDLREEYRRVEAFTQFRRENVPFARGLDEYLDKVKDLRRSVERTKTDFVLDEVELFEIKVFLLLCGEIAKIINRVRYALPPQMRLNPLLELLDQLDITGQRQYSFYIEDGYSENLQRLREEIRVLERAIYGAQKRLREEIKEETGVMPRSTGEIMVSKYEADVVERLEKSSRLSLVSSTFTHVTFRVKPTDEILQGEVKLEELKEEEQKEEFAVRERLSKAVGQFADALLANMEAIGKLDLLLAKARLVERLKAITPVILEGQPFLRIEDGRHPVVEANLRRKGRTFVPVSIELKKGVAVITGANMGGKTVTLKTVAVFMAMAQHGIPIPAAGMELSLVNFIFFSGGDYQSIDEGLSTFGAEIQRLKEAIPWRNERGLFCIDELARGTNPMEGYAIAAALVQYLQASNSVTLITTHFEGLAHNEEIEHWQVRGLKDADFAKIRREIDAQGKGGLEALHEYMDYRLEKIDAKREIPKDALNVARLMGLDDGVLNLAAEILEGKQVSAPSRQLPGIGR